MSASRTDESASPVDTSYSAADAARYAIAYGQSPQAEAARVLRDFMCCQAGQDLVEHGILRPFGYTLDPGPVVAENRELRDRLERLELRLEDEGR